MNLTAFALIKPAWAREQIARWAVYASVSIEIRLNASAALIHSSATTEG
jgi:hypothetical protein